MHIHTSNNRTCWFVIYWSKRENKVSSDRILINDLLQYTTLSSSVIGDIFQNTNLVYLNQSYFLAFDECIQNSTYKLQSVMNKVTVLENHT